MMKMAIIALVFGVGLWPCEVVKRPCVDHSVVGLVYKLWMGLRTVWQEEEEERQR